MSSSIRPSQSSVRILIVDSSRIGSQLLAGALKRDRLQVVHASANPEEALAEINRASVDIALVSATLMGRPGEGFDLAAQIRASNPSVKVVMLVDSSDRDSVVRAFRAGAHGVFGRDSQLESLTKCVTKVHDGQVWASSEELQYLLEALVAPPQLKLLSSQGTQLLAPREQEVVHWVAEGMTNREIADRLGLSENTVKNYLFRIFEKLGISKRVELVLYAASQFNAATAAVGLNPATTFANDTAAFQWCREAVERFASTPLALGEMFREGRGVAQNGPAALMWFLIAEELSAQLKPVAAEARSAMEAGLAPDQIATARSMATQWLSSRLASNKKPNGVAGKLQTAI